MGIVSNILRPWKKTPGMLQDQNDFTFNFSDGNCGSFNSSSTLETIYTKIAKDIASGLKVKNIMYNDKKEFKKLKDYVYELNVKPNDEQSAYDFHFMNAYQLIKYGYSLNFKVEDEFFIIDNYTNTIELSSDGYIYFSNGKDNTQLRIKKEMCYIMRLAPHHANEISKNSGGQLNAYIDLINKNLNSLENMLNGNGTIKAFMKLETNISNEALAKAEASWVKKQFGGALGGIGFMQKGQELVELKQKYEIIDKEQIMWLEDKLYEAFGLNKELFTANYTEAQYNAYYKSTLKPILKIYQNIYNLHLYDKKQYLDGYSLLFLLPQRDITSLKDYTTYLDKSTWSGRTLINEIRLEDGDDPIDGGDVPRVNLNMANMASDIGDKGGENEKD